MSPAGGTHLATLLGLGVSVIPKRAKPQGDHPFLVIRPIPNPEMLRTIGIVRRRNGSLRPGRIDAVGKVLVVSALEPQALSGRQRRAIRIRYRIHAWAVTGRALGSPLSDG